MNLIFSLSQSQINEITAACLVVIAVLVFVLISIRRRFTKNVNTQRIAHRWQTLQKNCATRKTWPIAIIEADNLLDDVLKSLHYKGKTTGERLVAAQHDISSNDSVWFGHKMRNQIVGQDVRTLKKADILNALAGFRQALKDLGALEK